MTATHTFLWGLRANSHFVPKNISIERNVGFLDTNLSSPINFSMKFVLSPCSVADSHFVHYALKIVESL